MLLIERGRSGLSLLCTGTWAEVSLCAECSGGSRCAIQAAALTLCLTLCCRHGEFLGTRLFSRKVFTGPGTKGSYM